MAALSRMRSWTERPVFRNASSTSKNEYWCPPVCSGFPLDAAIFKPAGTFKPIEPNALTSAIGFSMLPDSRCRDVGFVALGPTVWMVGMYVIVLPFWCVGFKAMSSEQELRSSVGADGSDERACGGIAQVVVSARSVVDAVASRR